MPTETIDLMVDAGNAKPGPATAQKLGPLGINIGEVMNKINEKTEAFKGMQVPVKLKIDTKAKEVSDIEVGTPPTTQLIKKELGLAKGSGRPDKEKVGNIAIEQCIKVAKMKKEAMFALTLKNAVKSTVGSCNSLGILIEGKIASEIEKEIDQGKYDDLINQEKTEVSEEKKKILETQLTEIQEVLAKELEKLKAIEEVKEEKKEEPEEKKEETTGKKEETTGKKGEKKGEKKEEPKKADKKEAKKK